MHVLMLVATPVATDTRVLREAGSLVADGGRAYLNRRDPTRVAGGPDALGLPCVEVAVGMRALLLMVVSDKAVEKHVSNIFLKLDLAPAGGDHRRVLAVLRWLEG